MKVLETVSGQIFYLTIEGQKYRVDSVAEYLLDNDMNQLKFRLYKYIDLGDFFELERMGTKFYEYDCITTDHIKSTTPNSKQVEYTDKVIETIVKAALKSWTE